MAAPGMMVRATATGTQRNDRRSRDVGGDGGPDRFGHLDFDVLDAVFGPHHSSRGVGESRVNPGSGAAGHVRGRSERVRH